MRRIAILGGLWMALFGAAAVIGHLLDDDPANAASVTISPTNQISEDAARRAGRMDLASKPRKSSGQVSELGGFDSSFAELNNEISKTIIQDKDKLLSCIEDARRASTKPTDFLEISFVVERNEPLGVYQLKELVLERTTIPLTPAEDQCFVDALGQFKFHSQSAPRERIFFPICMHSIHKDRFPLLRGEPASKAK
jgi:hypothetical protein